MHETVMEVMVNVLGEGESKVRNTFYFFVFFHNITLKMFFTSQHERLKVEGSHGFVEVVEVGVTRNDHSNLSDWSLFSVLSDIRLFC